MAKLQRYLDFKDGRYERSDFFARDTGFEPRALAARVRECSENSDGYLIARKVMSGKRGWWYYKEDQKEKVRAIGIVMRAPKYVKIENDTYEFLDEIAEDTGIHRNTLLHRIKDTPEDSPNHLDGRKIKIGLKWFWYINVREKQRLRETNNCKPEEFAEFQGKTYQKLLNFAEEVGKLNTTLRNRLENYGPEHRLYIKGRKFMFGLAEYWYVLASEKERIVAEDGKKEEEAEKHGKKEQKLEGRKAKRLKLIRKLHKKFKEKKRGRDLEWALKNLEMPDVEKDEAALEADIVEEGTQQ